MDPASLRDYCDAFCQAHTELVNAIGKQTDKSGRLPWEDPDAMDLLGSFIAEWSALIQTHTENLTLNHATLLQLKPSNGSYMRAIYQLGQVRRGAIRAIDAYRGGVEADISTPAPSARCPDNATLKSYYKEFCKAFDALFEKIERQTTSTSRQPWKDPEAVELFVSFITTWDPLIQACTDAITPHRIEKFRRNPTVSEYMSINGVLSAAQCGSVRALHQLTVL